MNYLYLIIHVVIFLLLGIRIVRDTHRGLIERLGKYKKLANPGFHWIIPVVDHLLLVNIIAVSYTHLPRKYLMVNIASFDLVLIEGVDTLISMRAIVGKDYRETPVFNALMTYIVFGPSWTVPPTILKNDVIPELLKGLSLIHI